MNRSIVLMTSILFLSLSICLGQPVTATGEKTYGTAVVAQVTSIYDGDTFRADIKDWPPIIGQRIGIRIAGIDCPELKDNRPAIKALALKAKQYTVKRLREAKKIELVDMMRDKYFRICTRVLVDGSDLGTELVREGLAKPYDGGKKIKWE
jgi:endonuclease YncB( thermonuclease family)